MKLLFLVLGWLVIFSGGCADGTNHPKPVEINAPQSQASPLQACTLLQEADARSILGDALKPGMQSATMCQYLSGSESLQQSGESVSLTIHQQAGNEFDQYIANTESSMGVKTEPVSGVGQKAAWADGTLVVQMGPDLLVILVGIRAEKEKHLELAKSLAHTIIGRMSASH